MLEARSLARIAQSIPSVDASLFTEATPFLSHPEALALPSVLRLNEFNQVSPVAERILGFAVSRGQHTKDAMHMTESFLTQLAASSPEGFEKMIEKFKLPPEKAIHHCVEYMRLHDAATLAFQGSMHDKAEIAGVKYDEDYALLKALEGEKEYQPISDLLFDAKTISYYEDSGIQIEIIKTIAQDSVNGLTPLGKLLKKGGDFPPIDWLAYTARDFYELTRIFGIKDSADFSEKIAGVYSGLKEVSSSLLEGTPFKMPEKLSEDKTITQLLPPSGIKWDRNNGDPRIVYDASAIAQIYLMHLVLRTSFSGSAWVKGTYRTTQDAFDKLHLSDDELLHTLLAFSEKELLDSVLKEELPITSLSPASLTTPESIPQQVKGWSYSTEINSKPTQFVFKKVRDTLVEMNGQIETLEKTFPRLMEFADEIMGQPPLYLNHIQ